MKDGFANLQKNRGRYGNPPDEIIRMVLQSQGNHAGKARGILEDHCKVAGRRPDWSLFAVEGASASSPILAPTSPPAEQPDSHDAGSAGASTAARSLTPLPAIMLTAHASSKSKSDKLQMLRKQRARFGGPPDEVKMISHDPILQCDG